MVRMARDGLAKVDLSDIEILDIISATTATGSAGEIADLGWLETNESTGVGIGGHLIDTSDDCVEAPCVARVAARRPVAMHDSDRIDDGQGGAHGEGEIGDGVVNVLVESTS